jgi:hypothetical protein
VAAAAGAVMIALALIAAGAWWAALPVGGALGLVLRGWAVPALAGAAGLVGWGIPLAVSALSAPVGPMAVVIGGVLGVRGAAGGVAALAATLLLGTLLGLAGAWVGASIRRLVSE